MAEYARLQFVIDRGCHPLGQIMDALIQHETYAEFLGNLRDRRNVEMDAMSIDAQKEKIYTDEDMWRNF